MGGQINIYEGDTKLMGFLPSPPPPPGKNLVMGSWPFLINLDNWFGDKFSFRYPVSELLDNKKSKNIAFLLLKNSHGQLWNFSSILIHSSGIYVEKWYPEKWHILHRSVWKSSPLPLALCHSILIF